jgi:hypothetical protein
MHASRAYLICNVIQVTIETIGTGRTSATAVANYLTIFNQKKVQEA